MRLSIALLAIAASATAQNTQACGFSDWLFGRSQTPYAVGYVPVATTTQAVGYAPVSSTAYVSGYVPNYSAGYGALTSGPAQAVTTLPGPAAATPATSSGVYQSQRPAYFDNPSVYTGMPVAGGVQSANRVPIASYRGVAPTSYVSGYAPAGAVAGQPVQVTPPTGGATAVAPVTPVAPIFSEPPRGLGRFHGSWIRTNYRSSYYRAPITYYRPVTSVDPVSGTTVTVQQPCTSYVQQLQRTPYNSLQIPQQPQQPMLTQPGCPAGGCGTTAPYSAVPPSGIGQVGAPGLPAQSAVPIPSTVPTTPASPFTQPYPATPPPSVPLNTAPLSGAPPLGPAPSVTPAPSYPPSTMQGPAADRAPVGQPRLENRPPTGAPAGGGGSSNLDSNGRQPNGNGGSDQGESNGQRPATRSYWEMQNAEDSTALIRPGRQWSEPQRDPVSLSSGQSGRAEPIPAPEDYVSPFRQRSSRPAPPTDGAFEAPPLPARSSFDTGDATSVSHRVGLPAGQRNRLNRPAVRPARSVQRDKTWTPIP